MTADLSFEQLATWIREGEVESITAALVATDEPARRALGKPLQALTAVHEPPAGMPPHDRWRRMRRCDDAMRVAGVTTEVWAAVRELLPAALANPSAGTPDLLTVAEAAAAAVRATDDLPELTRVATRRGRTRLITEAARLSRTLTANRTPGTA